MISALLRILCRAPVILAMAFPLGCTSRGGDLLERDGVGTGNDKETDTPGAGDTGTGEAICGDIEASWTLSEQIPTVAVVTWSTSLPSVSGGRVEFGRDGAVEYLAPIEPAAPERRTTLLGMKPSTAYDFQVVLEGDGVTCRSRTDRIETGPRATGLPIPRVTTFDPAAISGDFIVTSLATKRTVFILDKDGDIVWWYNFGNADYEGEDLLGFSRVHMSWDAAHMWGCNINFGRGNGRLYRVSMDGAVEDEPEITNHHHDFAVLPDNRLALLEFDDDGQPNGEGTCERIVERDADGNYEVIYPLREGLSTLATPTEWCHANAIHYDPAEDAYYVSVLIQSLIVKIDRAERRLLWVLDGDTPAESDFPGVTWVHQHGFHPLGDGTLLLFNNNDDAGDMGPSHALAIALDDEQGAATLLWRYEDSISCPMLGDVQRLSNGNTLVTYSTAGTFQELDGERQLVREITFGLGDAVGYADARQSLYGPPDRY